MLAAFAPPRGGRGSPPCRGGCHLRPPLGFAGATGPGPAEFTTSWIGDAGTPPYFLPRPPPKPLPAAPRPLRPARVGTGWAPMTKHPNMISEARARALKRRPASMAPTPPPAAPTTSKEFNLTQAARVRSARAARSSLARGRRLFAPRLRAQTYMGLTLLALTPLVGGAARGALGASVCLAWARVERRRRRLRRAPHRGRWRRPLGGGLRRSARLEVAARWFGRHGLGGSRKAATHFVSGALVLGWGWGWGLEAAHLGWLQ